MKLFLKELSCDGKIQPAKGSSQHEEDKDRKDAPSNARCMLIRQFIPLSNTIALANLRIATKRPLAKLKNRHAARRMLRHCSK